MFQHQSRSSSDPHKSFVSLEQHVCVVCGAPFDTGNLLLNKRLRNNMQRHTRTGWGLCPEHQKMTDEGYVALIECDPNKSGLVSGATNMSPEQAYRTGRVAHIRREKFPLVFNVPIAANQPCVFVEQNVIDMLQEMVEAAAQ